MAVSFFYTDKWECYICFSDCILLKAMTILGASLLPGERLCLQERRNRALMVHVWWSSKLALCSIISLCRYYSFYLKYVSAILLFSSYFSVYHAIVRKDMFSLQKEKNEKKNRKYFKIIYIKWINTQINSVQLLSHIWLSVSPWTTTC